MSLIDNTDFVSRGTRHGGVLSLLKAYFSTNRIGDLLLLQGKIDEPALQYALVLAQTRRQRIGRVLVDEGLIRRHDLYATLGKQWGLRTLAWGVTVFMSVGAFAPRQARADDRTGYTTSENFTVASNGALPRKSAIKPLSFYPALFGAAEKRSNDLSAFTKWTSMFARYDEQISQRSNAATLVSWKNDLGRYGGQSLPNMAHDVNAYFNRVEYIEDRDNYGWSDYWATPVEFLKHGGDCEDFAIAKYMSLKSLGVPEERLRIAIVHDLIKNIPHAILIVYADDGALVLDNQTKDMKFAADVTRYKPIFSINRQGWWLHSRGGNVQVASAAQ